VENPEGWGGYSLLQKMENPGRRGVLSEVPSVVGVWIFSGTTYSVILHSVRGDPLVKVTPDLSGCPPGKNSYACYFEGKRG